jgi:NADH-quinone oxidoreductase subunit E
LSFYGIFKQDQPHGRVRAWVCRSISCALRGGEEVLAQLCRQAGIRPGETTSDGALTVEFAECLGACEYAPCMLANKTLHKDLTTEKAEVFLKEVRTMNDER